ncbi:MULTISPECIES: hypothetical protein [Methanobacterium]|nr:MULTISPECIES: hypothetical protein [Methanobacterium]
MEIKDKDFYFIATAQSQENRLLKGLYGDLGDLLLYLVARKKKV